MLNRRILLRRSLWTSAAMACAPLRALEPNPVVETAAGKVRGTTANGINVFRGIPGGGATADVPIVLGASSNEGPGCGGFLSWNQRGC